MPSSHVAGYYGFRADNDKATCMKLGDETDVDIISKEVKVLRAARTAADQASAVLADGVENNRQGLVQISHRVNDLTDNTTNILGSMADEMETMQDRLSRLEDQNKQLMGANAALVAAMKAVVVDAGQ